MYARYIAEPLLNSHINQCLVTVFVYVLSSKMVDIYQNGKRQGKYALPQHWGGNNNILLKLIPSFRENLISNILGARTPQL